MYSAEDKVFDYLKRVRPTPLDSRRINRIYALHAYTPDEPPVRRGRCLRELEGHAAFELAAGLL